MIEERRTDENLGDWYYSANPYYQRGYGLPNCTCYAWGRLAEICNVPVTFYGGNAIMWASRPEMKQIRYPKVGSCIIYSGGIMDGYGHFCGHIGVIEHVYDDGTIDVSMSSFNDYTWRLYKLSPGDNYYIHDSYGLTFLGFFMYEGVQAIYDQEEHVLQEKIEKLEQQLLDSLKIRSSQTPSNDLLLFDLRSMESKHLILNNFDAVPLLICIVLMFMYKIHNKLIM